MRMKMVTESQTLKDAAKEFLAYKKAQKIRERTLKDYHKYIDPFIAQSSNSMCKQFWIVVIEYPFLPQLRDNSCIAIE